MAIIETVADAKDVRSTELDFVLEDYIDTDAVDRLVSEDNPSLTLRFELPENTVTVTNDGLIQLTGNHDTRQIQ